MEFKVPLVKIMYEFIHKNLAKKQLSICESVLFDSWEKESTLYRIAIMYIIQRS